ncbi:hypothetical protein B0H16DRAFT_1479534 [Mycena metata]|uniref:DUF6534 domain-containing protein n=1 Tax=Mycena metata TaxID=1033252 RepID=A0AAD7MDU9_9AGAR|nr:hypothetical protein B0H16DRAFT_1479534 [Mycena metata]
MVDTLVVWSIETVMITRYMGVRSNGIFSAKLSLKQRMWCGGSDSVVWFPFFLISAKLFSNCFLASLNRRQGLRESDSSILNFRMGSRSAPMFPPLPGETRVAAACRQHVRGGWFPAEL